MRNGNESRSGLPGLGVSRRVAWFAAFLMLGAAGCRRDMYDQPKYDVYEPSTFFANGTSSRQIPTGTVARGQLNDDTLYHTGKVDGKEADVFPFAVDAELIELGRNRYMVFCTPCHGRLGDGRGMVVRRGFSPPPTFHSEYLKKIPVGHFYNVITHGYGAMYNYAARIPVKQRWAITAYIRTLQYSRDADRNDLAPADLKVLAEAEKPGQSQRDNSKSLAEVQK